MTDETYQKVCEINNRLKELYRVKEKIQDSKRNYLTYAEKSDYLGDRDYLYQSCEMKGITTLLDKHDKMIRQEIDDEIDKLKKQIAEL